MNLKSNSATKTFKNSPFLNFEFDILSFLKLEFEIFSFLNLELDIFSFFKFYNKNVEL